MIVVKVEGVQLARLYEFMHALLIMEPGVTTLRVAIDPIDRAVKFKMDNGPWSPPYTGDVDYGGFLPELERNE
jgi:hypothetical protein